MIWVGEKIFIVKLNLIFVSVRQHFLFVLSNKENDSNCKCNVYKHFGDKKYLVDLSNISWCKFNNNSKLFFFPENNIIKKGLGKP